MSQLISPPSQSAQRVIYVSPSFTGVSPFFNTIQNALASCDGINETIIYAYRGTYNFPNQLEWKNNVTLQGVNKHTVFLNLPDPNNNIISFPAAPINWAFQDVTFFSSSTVVDYAFNMACTSNLGIETVNRLSNVHFANFSNIGYMTFSEAGFEKLIMENVTMENCLRIFVSYPKSNWMIRNVYSDGFFQLENGIIPIYLFHCKFSHVLVKTGGTVRSENSIFKIGINGDSFDAAYAGTRILSNCNIIVQGGVGSFLENDGTVEFDACNFEGISGAVDKILKCSGAQIMKLNNCKFKNAKIMLDNGATGKLTIINCQGYNGAVGVVQLIAAAGITPLLVNCTSQFAFAGAIVLMAGSANNNVIAAM